VEQLLDSANHVKIAICNYEGAISRDDSKQQQQQQQKQQWVHGNDGILAFLGPDPNTQKMENSFPFPYISFVVASC